MITEGVELEISIASNPTKNESHERLPRYSAIAFSSKLDEVADLISHLEFWLSRRRFRFGRSLR